MWVQEEALADEVRRHADFRLSNGLAIDLDRIAREYLGYSLERRENFHHEGRRLLGACFFDDDLIVIETRGFEPRLRFSLAHEIGHALIDQRIDEAAPQALRCDRDDLTLFQEPVGDARKSSRARSEYLANRFASALLMPARELPHGPLSEADHERLATRFGVSKRALRVRLEALFARG